MVCKVSLVPYAVKPLDALWSDMLGSFPMKRHKKHGHGWDECPPEKPKATRLRVKIGKPILKEGSIMPLSVSITTEEKVLVTSVPTNDAGAEVKSDEPVKYNVTSGTVTLEPQTDGTSSFIVSGSVEETASVDVSDASGKLKDTITVTVGPAAGSATSLKLSAATPVKK